MTLLEQSNKEVSYGWVTLFFCTIFLHGSEFFAPLLHEFSGALCYVFLVSNGWNITWKLDSSILKRWIHTEIFCGGFLRSFVQSAARVINNGQWICVMFNCTRIHATNDCGWTWRKIMVYYDKSHTVSTCWTGGNIFGKTHGLISL